VNPKQIAVVGEFDNIRSHHLRFLEEASKFGEVTVLLPSDAAIHERTSKAPKFPLPERQYFLEAVRSVARVIPVQAASNMDVLPAVKDFRPEVWVDEQANETDARRDFCMQKELEYHVLNSEQMKGFPERPITPSSPGRRKVIVTGCYDWFHSGHVRFFEEVSAYGDLYVIVGHDANIRLLKGAGHPLLPQEERRYMAGSIRYVKQALVSSGEGWLDAEPEIKRLKPDVYVVNEDGDKGGKRDYCTQNGIEYLVLKRTPVPGLPKRSSTDLRGF
jgi:cytidyltransferase-like protein